MKAISTYKRHSNRKQCSYCGVTLTHRSILPAPQNRTPEKMLAINDRRTWDHIIPASCGGKIQVPCCSWCNNLKGDKSLTAWLQSKALSQRVWDIGGREEDAEPMHERILYQLRDEDLFRIRTALEYHAD